MKRFVALSFRFSVCAVLASCTTQTSGSGGAALRVTAQPAAPDRAMGHQQVVRGREVVLSQACGECHGGGNNPAARGWLAGVMAPEQLFVLGPGMTLRPKNLTPDSATGTGRYTERQIFNALRYGLRPATTPDIDITSSVPGQGNHPVSPDYLAPLMPWPAWRHLPDEDLRAMAAYIKRGLRAFANKVEESDAPPDKWRSEVTPEKIGAYPAPAYPTANETGVHDPKVLRGRDVAIRKDCGGCHAGGPNPAAPGFLAGMTSAEGEFQIGPFKTRPRNITPDNATGIGRFTERQIFNALRYGLRPGETPDVEITSTIPGQGNFPARPKYLAPPMPWGSWRHSSDEELWALAAYLKHGVKPVSNRVADSEGPPDFWAEAYDPKVFGTYPAAPFPTANETGIQ